MLVRDLKVLRANTDRPVKMTIPGPFTMSKQAQDDFYRDGEAVALDFAAAVNAEILELFAAGADIVQLDEPWMQQHPDDARRYGLAALDRALDGVTGTVAVHLCFGYAALVHGKPTGYSFLPELENSKAAQISIEAAQPRLDLKILKSLPSKTIVLGVNDLADENAETPELVAARIRAALAYVPAERLAVAPDCGMKYLPRRGCLRQNESARRRRRDREAGDGRQLNNSPLPDRGEAATASGEAGRGSYCFELREYQGPDWRDWRLSRNVLPRAGAHVQFALSGAAY